MAIPDYQSLMLPVLRLASDGGEHRISDIVAKLATQLKLTDGEREELLPSGKQPIFNNRVHWAKTYLAQAKLLIGTRRAFFTITDRGRSGLSENVERIDAKFLRRFDEFNVFVTTEKRAISSPDATPDCCRRKGSQPEHPRRTFASDHQGTRERVSSRIDSSHLRNIARFLRAACCRFALKDGITAGPVRRQDEPSARLVMAGSTALLTKTN